MLSDINLYYIRHIQYISSYLLQFLVMNTLIKILKKPKKLPPKITNPPPPKKKPKPPQKTRIKNKQTSLIKWSIISGNLTILRLENENHFPIKNQSFVHCNYHKYFYWQGIPQREEIDFIFLMLLKTKSERTQ